MRLHVRLVGERVRANLTSDSHTLVNFPVVAIHVCLVKPSVLAIGPSALWPVLSFRMLSLHVILQPSVGRGCERALGAQNRSLCVNV